MIIRLANHSWGLRKPCAAGYYFYRYSEMVGQVEAIPDY